MDTSTIKIGQQSISLTKVHTLVIGSGAAGLNAAVQLRRAGVEDVLIVTEGLEMGTSINTGSDKQTYYKLSLCGEDADAPRRLAQNFFAPGSMHGDLALVEAAVSARAFLHLVSLGVPFPQDPYGQFVGYKTDHDPFQRATSIGPYTSREMCRALIREVKRLAIPVHERVNVAALVTVGAGNAKRACGAIALDAEARPVADLAENVVFAAGGPGGLYKTSVYPEVHTGGIGLALLAGAKAQSLPLSQYGLASTRFRWNVSGTYMQVIPRFVSTAADGASDPREFLRDHFQDPGAMNSMVFLKGYQWPFDSRKVRGGSSIIDILVYIETVQKGRRVFLDFRENPVEFSFAALSEEGRTYLEKSKACLATPIERLRHMNPGAISLYRDHGIDINTEMLEIAVCAQHNNGGLAANHWWESLNVKHLFPVGEVNGSHGVARPGGSALNSGQVGSIRAADFIGHRYAAWSVDTAAATKALETAAAETLAYLETCRKSKRPWQAVREAFQARMSRAAAHIRAPEVLTAAVAEAEAEWQALARDGCAGATPQDLVEAVRNRQLCFAQRVYLAAVKFAVDAGAGSRGSCMVLASDGKPADEKLGSAWRFTPENESFRDKVLETTAENNVIRNEWTARRPIPQSDTWFETAWAAYREGKIFE